MATTASSHDAVTASAMPEVAFRHIVACVAGPAMGDLVVPHALAIARAFGGHVTVLGIVPVPMTTDIPADPLEWEMRRREAHERAEQVVHESGGDVPMAVDVIETRAGDEICRWADDHRADLMVVCGCDAPEATEWPLARALLDRVPGSVLVVHASAATHAVMIPYRRLLVPLDGSARAESVVPLAAQVAASAAAELIVAHVVPAACLTEAGPPDAEDAELQQRITRRNERVARTYLDRLRSRFATAGSPPRTLVARDGDVRTRLERIVEEESVDLVVLSSHGHSGRSSVPYGSVTADLVRHSPVPLLIVRPRPAHGTRHDAAAATPVRLPYQATS